jgi:glycosyltransferase involved in cell wall biosynthesis
MYHAHVIGTLAALAARYRGPVIWNIRQGLDDPSALSRSTRVALRAGAMIRSRADAMIFNSVRALEQHVARGYSHGGVVIANGLDLPQAAARSRSPAPIIGMAAHFHPKKDYGNYFAACARVSAAFPEARFVAAGRGVDGANPELAAALAASGVPADRVSLLGDLDEMSGFYRSLDILVLSSRTEGFPNVLVEAMSFGVPCVSTDVGDAAIAVGDTGRIVPPRDSAALAQAVQGLLSLPADAYAQLSAAARRRVEDHYSIDGVAAQYDAFIEECIVRAADRRGAGARGHN